MPRRLSMPSHRRARQITLAAALAMALLLFLLPRVGADVGDVTVTVANTETTRVTTSDDSTVATSDGSTTVEVTVPAGGLPEGSSLEVSAIADMTQLLVGAPPPPDVDLVTSFQIRNVDASGTTITGDLAQPAALSFEIPATTVPAGAADGNLVLAFWNGAEWVVTDASFVTNADGSITVSAEVGHLTLFSLMKQPDSPFSGTLPQSGGFASLRWLGVAGTNVADAIALLDGEVEALFQLEASSGKWLVYFPGAPPLVNSIATLSGGQIVTVRTAKTTSAAAPPPASAPATPATTPNPTPAAPGTVVVQSGEGLIGIAERFGVEWEQVAALSGIAAPGYAVQPGQVLTLPSSNGPNASYTLVARDGDSLGALGLLFGVDWLAIADLSGVRGPDYIVFEGQLLTIPSPAAAPGPRFVTVTTGDTLFGIATRLAVNWIDIAELSGLSAPNYVVWVGQTLVVPPSR